MSILLDIQEIGYKWQDSSWMIYSIIGDQLYLAITDDDGNQTKLTMTKKPGRLERSRIEQQRADPSVPSGTFFGQVGDDMWDITLQRMADLHFLL